MDVFAINEALCIRCGSCVKACPVGVFCKNEDGSICVQQKECLNCLHCAAACPVGAVSEEGSEQELCVPAGEDGSLLSRFRHRRSIRHFKDTLPDAALLQAALDGAAYAPSAKNRRAYRWTVVLGSEKVEELYRLAMVWAKGDADYRHLTWLQRYGINPVTCGAPALIFVHSPEAGHSAQTDCVIAMTLAEQLLADSGLGTCWAGYLCRIVNECETLRSALSLPEDHQVCGVLMVGLPDEHYPNVPRRPAAEIRWIR